MNNEMVERKTSLPELKSVGGISPKNIEEMWRFADVLVKSGMLPERFKSREMVVGALQFALELNLKPFTALKNIAMVEGTPMIFGELPLSIVLRSGKLEWIDEFYIDKDQNKICFDNKNLNAPVWGAVCITKRIGVERACERFFTIEDKERAGLKDITYKGYDTVWKKHLKIMLMYRARAVNLKSLFADCLNGISISELDSDNPIYVESTPIDSNKTIMDDNKFTMDESLVAPDIEPVKEEPNSEKITTEDISM